QHQIRSPLAARLARGGAVGGHGDLVALVLEDLLHQRADIGLVVDDQDVSVAHAPASIFSCLILSLSGLAASGTLGMRTTTSAPGSALRALIRPLCSSTIFLTMAMPSPVPLGLVVT